MRRLLEALVLRDFVALEATARADAGIAGEASRAARRGAPAPRRARGPRGRARRRPRRPSPGCAACTSCSTPAVAERVIFDLGLVRNIGYYTGAVFDVYDPALGAPIGGGGRYDELLGRFGRSLPAVGFALGVDRLHIALAGEERGTGALLARDGTAAGEAAR